MKRSIYLRLVLIYFFIIFLGNFAARIFGSYTIDPLLTKGTSNAFTEILNVSRNVLEKGGITVKELEGLYASEIITVKSYENINELAFNYQLSSEELGKINNYPTTFSGKWKIGYKFKSPVSVIKFGYIYIAAALNENYPFSDFGNIILMYNLLSIFFGTIVMLFAAHFIVDPIKKLTWATDRIAGGDFSVQIEKKRKDEIGQLVDNFNKMAKELASTEMLRNNFISDISHEFKTPLTSIEGYTKLLKNCKNDSERDEYIEIITRETKRLSVLSGNILLLNRIENENITQVKDTFRLDEQIRQVILLSENKWISKNMDLNIELEEIKYTGNEQLLFQVWLNLLDNAIKFSNRNEAIEIRLKRQDGQTIFSIMDYGKGMSEEQQKRMSEKFYTGDKSRNTEGNGLGLSIVKRIVDIHGGTIDVQGRKDEFTLIKVIL
ncbi:heme sensor protein HssS [Oxobacter pfennigii]|uniref:Heme sensor protein HssS n=1 Tax=Oxobacter pfennigii TaxID=36849 RepID=A0A0P8X1N1_9CLOT|nr:HAMP domain-containing sensor histidine kinase [Oxobacter pfennigii]KPU44722.1 heme sensor protein HssS [Oxobacter pfennigii]